MNTNDYKNTLTYPSKPIKPRMSSNPTKADADKYFQLMEEYEIAEKKYRELKEAYEKRGAELLEQFKQDLFEDLGITDNPKKDKLFSIAWDKGHGSGFGDVYSEACSMVDLIL